MSSPAHLPAVDRDERSAAFFDAARNGRLLLQRCRDSGTIATPNAQTCPECGSSAFEAIPASGLGRLISWTVVHRAPTSILADAVPYLAAVVELEEGPWLLVRLLASSGAKDGRLGVGAPVQAKFVPSGQHGDGEYIPVFDLVGSEQPSGGPSHEHQTPHPPC